uniref:NADH-ubiquinone oxidoreductase chain 5 n=1 Tax=Pterolophia sp. ZJY-2019 TaxID=2604362 RepID=A0A5B9RI22_9CUCU|nr:NADH dehydrogenase subunit 5 [Pterolophia sp. ZJY-2019]QEG58700.1 NADH dehydrogenase subunit 5 [Pterolophia sp. ZJY-2019]
MLSICKIYFSLFLSLSLTLFIFSMKFLMLDYSMIIEYSLVNLNSTLIVFTILFDWMSLLFMSFVLFISSMVILYSEEYMGGDLFINRFILLVVMFVLSMMLLIISPNLISILLGWDGLGLVSYCLVIYYQNVKSYNAGMLTALSNRIGDVALLLSIAWMVNYGSWNYVYYLECMKEDSIMQLISILIVLAAMTKSAQIPFSSWLPAAMAAPTPVSSLVHSSTLVTAGVYLLIRFEISFSDNLKFFLLLIASLTMFMSGLGANFEFDLKKIIALSTLSQLGLMMSILSLGGYYLAFFHLLTHALFKALLFMCAGFIIHSVGNCQDIRYLGVLLNKMPLVCSFFNICNFSLCGLPFLSGFYSKDLIVEVMSMGYLNFFIYFLFYVSIGLTVCYSFRLTYYSLTGENNGLTLNSLSESKSWMINGMMGLISLVVIMGSVLMWTMFSTPYFIILPMIMKLMTLLMIMIGMYLGYELGKFKINYMNKSLNLLTLSSFLSMMWNLPILSTLGVNYFPIKWGEIYSKSFDKGWIEYYGGQNLSMFLKKQSQFMQVLSLNHLKVYLLLMILWIVFMLIFM